MCHVISGALRLPKSPSSFCRAIQAFNARHIARSAPLTPFLKASACRTVHTSPTLHQGPSTSTSHSPSSRTPDPHRNFYRTHGRALFKTLTLAFFSYQVCYWVWLVLETEEIKDRKSREINSLEGEVRLLDEGRKSRLAGEGEKG